MGGYTSGSLGGPSAGGNDAYVARYTGAGERLWIRQFGSAEHDAWFALAPDSAGGVFAAGPVSWGGAAFRVILARYNGDGDLLWDREFGSGVDDRTLAAAPDGAGGVYITGYTGGALGGPWIGRSDAWLARYDGDGERVWIRQFGTTESDIASSAASDGQGGVVICGETTGAMGGAPAGEQDVFIARFNSEGDQLWVRQFGSSANDGGRAVAADMTGIVVAGETWGSLAGPSAGEKDAWLARYDFEGNRIWAHQFGTGDRDSANAVVADGAGGAYVAGGTGGSLARPLQGVSDAFLARYDQDGRQVWISQFGTSSSDSARTVTAGAMGGLFVAGDTGGSLGAPSAGGVDAWVARYGADACYADCDGDGSLTFFDFLCFQNLFATGDPRGGADCDGDSALTFFDFLCFQDAFAQGCP